MKTVLLVKGGRHVPAALLANLSKAGYTVVPIDMNQEDWSISIPEAFGVLLMAPEWGRGSFLISTQLWQRYLLEAAPQCRLLIAGYETISNTNYLDILQMGNDVGDWMAQTVAVEDMNLPAIEGIDLMEKLHRFFAGHGEDSVVAVLSRIRLVVQMASRELQKMNTPYAEIYQELVEPAQLDKKWAEWRNRWINYFPLFAYTPIAAKLRYIGEATNEIEAWMLTGGQAEEPLVNGRILNVLNIVREELQQIEKQYVVQKLSHTYR